LFRVDLGDGLEDAAYFELSTSGWTKDSERVATKRRFFCFLIFLIARRPQNCMSR
jgi:hypothetical protein